jgi:hypothetical protein
MTPDEAIAQGVGSTRSRRIVRWLFINRRTDGITIAQWPNVALSVTDSPETQNGAAALAS